MKITHFTDSTTVNSICGLWGIPHQLYPYAPDGNDLPQKMLRGSWIELEQGKIEVITSCVLPGNRIQLCPFFIACAEVCLGSLCPKQKLRPQEVIVAAMVLALHADHNQPKGFWKECILAMESCGDIDGKDSDFLSSFLSRNKMWISTELSWGKPIRAVVGNVLKRFRKEVQAYE